MSINPPQVYSFQKQLEQQNHIQNQKRKLKDYLCPCGRSYGSYPALYSHIKRKHDGVAPGEVTKPKPSRKRGRPFKYEPQKFQNQNPHKSASKHLSDYLMNVQRNNANQFPLKQFAHLYNNNQAYFAQNNLEANERKKNQQMNDSLLINPQSSDKYYQIRIENNTSFQPFSNRYDKKENLMSSQQFYGTNPNMKFPQNSYGNGFNYQQNSQERSFQTNNLNQLRQIEKQRFGQAPVQNMYQSAGFNPNLFNNRLQNVSPMLGQRPLFQSKYPSQQQNDFVNMIYQKPFERQLKREMQTKFKPIQQGVINFLEPILREITNQENISQQIQRSSKKHEVIDLDSDQAHDKHQNQTSNKNSKSVEKPSMEASPKKLKPKVQEFLQNQHFSDILKWLMSPPEHYQNNERREKQNYIQFSFRCSIVQFLDFLNHFLQTDQYQQVLLMFTFFCDHILAVTGSFQIRPQPQIYELPLYFNDFIDEYLPKLLQCMQDLKSLFIFSNHYKKASQLFMWYSSWMSMQQYYHNKYYRQMIKFQIQQQNLKAFLYQQNYENYIREAMKQNKQAQTLRELNEEKVQQQPQIQILGNHQNEDEPEQKRNIIQEMDKSGQIADESRSNVQQLNSQSQNSQNISINSAQISEQGSINSQQGSELNSLQNISDSSLHPDLDQVDVNNSLKLNQNQNKIEQKQNRQTKK